jgi:hypothetical protein
VSTRTVSFSVPFRRSFLKTLAAALVGAAIAVVVVLSLTRGGRTDSSPKPEVFRSTGFALAAPKGWRAQPNSGAALTIERAGRGVVVVKTGLAPKDQSLKTLTAGLTAQLTKRFADFRFVSARVRQLRGGHAYLFTFARSKAGTAQSLALVKLGTTNYTIDTITKANDIPAAAEAAAIVRSFGP